MKTEYLLAKVYKNKMHTIKGNYPYTLPYKCKELLLKITDKIQIFYKNEVFNSVVVGEEENVYVLKADTLMVVRKSDCVLERDRVYMFKIVEKNVKVSRAVLHVSTIYSGEFCNGEILIDFGEAKENSDSKKIKFCKPHELSKLSESNSRLFPLILQRRHVNGDILKVVRVANNTFCEVDNPLKSLTGKITNVDPYVVTDGLFQALIFEKGFQKVGDIVKVRIKSELFGKYIATFQQFDIQVGRVYTATVQSVTPTAVYLSINGFVGRMKMSEGYRGIGKCKSVVGMVYKIDEEKMNFEFSVKKFSMSLKFAELDGPVVSIPFELKNF